MRKIGSNDDGRRTESRGGGRDSGVAEAVVGAVAQIRTRISSAGVKINRGRGKAVAEATGQCWSGRRRRRVVVGQIAALGSGNCNTQRHNGKLLEVGRFQYRGPTNK
jgi:hypothetical protein